MIGDVEWGSIDVYSWTGTAEDQVQDISTLVCRRAAVVREKEYSTERRQEIWSLSEVRL